MPANHIFIYGSLRKEFFSPIRSVLDDHAEFIGQAIFQGELYKIDWYPGVVESNDPDDIVIGEVYKIINSEIIFEKLDRYEGCSPADPKPHEFIRKESTIKFQNGAEMTAWVYLYDLSVEGKERIHSGDYVKNEKGLT